MNNLWITGLDTREPHKPNLICFPFSGGSAQFFFPWRSPLEDVNVLAVQLPGRANRYREAVFTEMHALIEVLADQLKSVLTPPFFFFGHSLGSLIAFELARYLQAHALPSPDHVFVSGYSAPQCEWPLTRRRPKIMHNLPKEEFVRQLRVFKGTPSEILDNPELLDLFLPALVADFTILDTYQYQSGARLTSPVTAFGGLQDTEDFPKETIKAWEAQTQGERFSYYMLPGEHFFIKTSESLLFEILRNKMNVE